MFIPILRFLHRTWKPATAAVTTASFADSLQPLAPGVWIAAGVALLGGVASWAVSRRVVEARQWLFHAKYFFLCLLLVSVGIGLLQLLLSNGRQVGAIAALVPSATLTDHVPSSDPLEILTRRGYAASEASLYRAIAQGRAEDVDLLLKAGVKFSDAPIRRAHIPADVWAKLIKADAIKRLPCSEEFNLPTHQALLEGAVRHNNLEIYNGLCGGAYVVSLKQHATEALNNYDASVADNENKYSALQANWARTKPYCVAQLETILSESAVRNYLNCTRALDESVRKKSADICASVDRRIGDLEAEFRQKGLSRPLHGLDGDCIPGARDWDSCRYPVARMVANSYYNWVVQWKRPMAEFRKRQSDLIEQACSNILPKKATVSRPSDYEFFKKLTGTVGAR